MADFSQLKTTLNQVGDSIAEQEWFQELKGKWEELDPQSRLYLKAAGAGAGVVLCLILVLSSMWSLHGLKKEIDEKSELLGLIDSANDELRRLHEAGAPTLGHETSAAAGAPGAQAGGAEAPPWPPYFETAAQTAGIDKASLTLSDEKPGSSSANDAVKESLIDVGLKHVNIKQVIRYVYGLENGARPLKLRNLTIDTKSDPTGYLDATLAMSAFRVKP